MSTHYGSELELYARRNRSDDTGDPSDRLREPPGSQGYPSGRYLDGPAFDESGVREGARVGEASQGAPDLSSAIWARGHDRLLGAGDRIIKSPSVIGAFVERILTGTERQDRRLRVSLFICLSVLAFEVWYLALS